MQIFKNCSFLVLIILISLNQHKIYNGFMGCKSLGYFFSRIFHAASSSFAFSAFGKLRINMRQPSSYISVFECSAQWHQISSSPIANVAAPSIWLFSSTSSFYHSFQADFACALSTAFSVTVELQDLRFNRRCDGSEICCAKKVFNSLMIRQPFACNESNNMISEKEKFLQGFQGPVNTF